MSCCGKNKYPSALTMARDLSVTVVQAMRHAVKTGEFMTTASETKKRLETCQICEKKTGVRCSMCGCYISLKTAVLTATCPIGKW